MRAISSQHFFPHLEPLLKNTQPKNNKKEDTMPKLPLKFNSAVVMAVSPFGPGRRHNNTHCCLACKACKGTWLEIWLCLTSSVQSAHLIGWCGIIHVALWSVESINIEMVLILEKLSEQSVWMKTFGHGEHVSNQVWTETGSKNCTLSLQTDRSLYWQTLSVVSFWKIVFLV